MDATSLPGGFKMKGYDPFAPSSSAKPPTDGVQPEGVEVDPDYSVLTDHERDEAGRLQTATEALNGDEAPQPSNDAPANAEAPQPPAEGPDGGTQEEVKVGTAKEVLDWVTEPDDDDAVKARAQAALDAENASGEPRKGLSADLEAILSDDSGA